MLLRKKNLTWTIFFLFLSVFFTTFFLTHGKENSKCRANRKNKCHFLYRLLIQNKIQVLTWFVVSYFSCPAAFSRVFYVVFQIFKLKHFCNELLHERTVNFGSDTKTESASPKKVESSAGTFWLERGAHRFAPVHTVPFNRKNIHKFSSWSDFSGNTLISAYKKR